MYIRVLGDGQVIGLIEKIEKDNFESFKEKVADIALH
jgi:hypothetical protein